MFIKALSGDRAIRTGAGTDPRRFSRASSTYLAVGIIGSLLVGMALRFNRHSIDSDSAAQQSFLYTWWNVGHREVFVPQNTWILKYPIYILVEQLPAEPQVRILIESILLNGIGFLLVGFSCWKLAGMWGTATTRKIADITLPVAWILTTSGSLGGYLSIMPNYRNIELGIQFLVLLVVAKYLRFSSRSPGFDAKHDLGMVAILASLSLLWVDDPYFEFLLGLPLAGLGIAWFIFRQRDWRILLVSLGLVLSIGLAKVLRLLLGSLGVRIPQNQTSQIDVAGAVGRLKLLWPSIVAQLGFDQSSLAGVAVIITSMLLLVGGTVAGVALARRGLHQSSLVATFLGLHAIVVLLGALSSRLVFDYHAGRYLMPAMLDAAVCLGLIAAIMREHRPQWAHVITVILTLAVAANVTQGIVNAPDRPDTFAQREEILAGISQGGATKGFAEYWSTNIYVYDTRGKLQVSPIECRDGRLAISRFLTDSARWKNTSGHTFLIWEQGYFVKCPLDSLERQFGRAVTRVDIPSPTDAGPAVLLTYDHDITEFLQP